MKRVSFIFILIFISKIPFAQTNLDSLWSIWQDESQTDCSRAEALLEYSYEKFKHRDSSSYYYKQAYAFASEGECKKEMALALRGIGIIEINKGNYSESLQLLEQSLAISEEIKDNYFITMALEAIGWSYYRSNDFRKSKGYYTQSIQLLEKSDNIDSILLIRWYYNLGEMSNRMGDYSEQLKYHQKALKLAESTSNMLQQASILDDIGSLYSTLENYTEALKYKQRANKILESEADFNYTDIMGSNLNGIAVVLDKLNRHDEAREYYQRALIVAEKLGSKVGMATVYYGIGWTYFILEEYDTALNYLYKSQELYEEISYPLGIASIKRGISYALNKLNRYTLAIEYGDYAKKEAGENGWLDVETDAAEVLYQAYKGIGNIRLALAYHEEWQTLKDSLKKETLDNDLILFEFEQQRMADSLAVVEDKLRADLEFQETISAEKQTRNAFMYGGFGILLIAGGLFGRVRYVRKTNKELEEKNLIIAREKVRAEESEKAKEQFFNNVSHEFRTPLTLIAGPLEDILQGKIDEHCRDQLKIMQRSAGRLQVMINELLDLSKLEFKKISLQAAEENIVKVTGDYMQSFESLADQRHIKLLFRSQKEHYPVYLDMEKYQKILANLLSNALKFTGDNGKVEVVISEKQTSLHMKSGDVRIMDGIEISVTDDGIGIPDDKLPHIFDRFFQVGDKSFSQQAGTGIGLALTKELVELHHGIIQVESSKGAGTTFKVFLPKGNAHLTESEIITKKQEVPVEETKQKDWAVEEDISGHVVEAEIRKKDDKEVILVVEDNPDMQRYIISHLKDKYHVLKARDGEEGLAMALEQVPDLVLSDVMMPRMDGNEMTERIKTDERTSHIPVILLTARASVDSKIEGLETGADAYLTKPFNARELKVVIGNLIEQRRKLRELFSKALSSGKPITESNLRSMDQKFIEKAIEVVEQHLSDPDFDVKLFASEMALSRAQLHRKIKGISNKSTGEFIRTIRLNKAAEMLRAKTDTVTQIAYETGFSNLSWFAKAFKEQFGASPSEYFKSS